MLVYGIDFGTSNSILGAADENGTRGFVPLDPNAADPFVLRSLLYFPSSSEVFFGSQAITEYTHRDLTGRFIRSIKKQLPSRSFVGTYVDNRPLNLENLIGIFLGELRRRANAHFGEDVKRVVLGRPARFAEDDADDRFAQARLEQAARLAGFTEIQFLAEPVAASLGYQKDDSLTESAKQSRTSSKRNPVILTVDYGGGTSDFTVYQVSGKQFVPSDVLSMGGVSVAGDALDASIMRKQISPYFGTGVKYRVPFGDNALTMPLNLMERICHPGEISLLRRQDTFEFLKNVKQWSLGGEDELRMERLFTLLEDQLGFPVFEQIERTKRTLSSELSTTFEYHYPGVDIVHPVTRRQFEEDAAAAFEKMDQSLQATISASGLQDSQIDQVLCTGGTSRVSWIRESLIRRFGADKIFDLDPFRGVARGLCERAHEWARE